MYAMAGFRVNWNKPTQGLSLPVIVTAPDELEPNGYLAGY
jgi:hypothetical protein